jgi:putative transposase
MRIRFDAVVGLLDVGVSTVQACALVGYPRASFYRHRAGDRPRPVPMPHADRYQPAALSAAERAAVLELLNREEYAPFSICQAFYRAWDDGHYVASKSSWYRVARDAGQVVDRRRQAVGSPKKIPELVATAPSQVWSWDITKLRGPRHGMYYHLYVIVDIYSRMIVGWRVEDTENSALAEQMIADAVTANTTAPNYLHSDNGSSMISQPVAVLLERLGVAKSLSRPKVSNDNPYSEALFKTVKYDLSFPGAFQTLEDAELFCTWFVHEYNVNHRHSALGWHTPHNVHHGNTTAVTGNRRNSLDRAWRAHPERFKHRPKPPVLPTRAHINQPGTTQPHLSHTG